MPSRLEEPRARLTVQTLEAGPAHGLTVRARSTRARLTDSRLTVGLMDTSWTGPKHEGRGPVQGRGLTVGLDLRAVQGRAHELTVGLEAREHGSPSGSPSRAGLTAKLDGLTRARLTAHRPGPRSRTGSRGPRPVQGRAHRLTGSPIVRQSARSCLGHTPAGGDVWRVDIELIARLIGSFSLAGRG